MLGYCTKIGLKVQLVNVVVITQPGKLCQVNITIITNHFRALFFFFFFGGEQSKPFKFSLLLLCHSGQTSLIQNTVLKNIFVESLMGECTYFNCTISQQKSCFLWTYYAT